MTKYTIYFNGLYVKNFTANEMIRINGAFIFSFDGALVAVVPSDHLIILNEEI